MQTYYRVLAPKGRQAWGVMTDATGSPLRFGSLREAREVSFVGCRIERVEVVEGV